MTVDIIIGSAFGVFFLWASYLFWSPIWRVRKTPKVTKGMTKRELERTEFELELTPAGIVAATDKVIDEIDKQLADMGVYEAQIAIAERSIVALHAVPPPYFGKATRKFDRRFRFWYDETEDGKRYEPGTQNSIDDLFDDMYEASRLSPLPPSNMIQPLDAPYPVEIERPFKHSTSLPRLSRREKQARLEEILA